MNQYDSNAIWIGSWPLLTPNSTREGDVDDRNPTSKNSWRMVDTGILPRFRAQLISKILNLNFLADHESLWGDGGKGEDMRMVFEHILCEGDLYS